MTRIRRLLPGLLLAAATALAACRSAVVEQAPPAPDLPASGFLSIGPADAPLRAREAADPNAPLVCSGPMLAISAQPNGHDLAEARVKGYRTVVNFRSPDEDGYVDQRAEVEGLGLRYVAIPVKGRAVEPAHADALAEVLADPAAGPVLMHCRSGTRAAMVWTVWLARHGGLTAEDALRYGERAGLSGETKAAAEKALR